MKCYEVMKRPVSYLSPKDSCQDAAIKMREENVGFLPVCDAHRKVLGTVTDRDIAIRLVAERHEPTTSVEEIMSRELVSCSENDDLRQAEELMGQHHKSRILCLDAKGFLVGVISLSDVARVEEASRVKDTWRRVAEREVRA